MGYGRRFEFTFDNKTLRNGWLSAIGAQSKALAALMLDTRNFLPFAAATDNASGAAAALPGPDNQHHHQQQQQQQAPSRGGKDSHASGDGKQDLPSPLPRALDLSLPALAGKLQVGPRNTRARTRTRAR